MFFLVFSCKEKELAREDLPWVYVKETGGQYQLMRNGRPYYIHGAAAGADFLPELKQAGANTVRIYDTTDLATTLDRAGGLGIAVVVDIPLPKFNNSLEYYENPDLFELLHENVARVVSAHKDHPALLYWNLGNELYYPYFYKRTKAFERFNTLIDLVHELDPNHPVSTTTIGANKLRVLSIELKSPQLDFISFNSFGSLSSFKEKLLPLTPFWNGPHVITEWGVNGPWEAPLTSWGVPVEETSTKKAEQITERYLEYIRPLREENSLGSFVFYWGQKNEVTPTWYSLFDENHLKSQSVYALSNIWEGRQDAFPGPVLEYVLLNGKGALDDIILSPGEAARAKVFFSSPSQNPYSYHWEIREESWLDFHISRVVAATQFQQEYNQVWFVAPAIPGPYRLHLKITNNSGYFASANVPFYVLDPGDER